MNLTREMAIKWHKKMWTDIAEIIEWKKEIVDITEEKKHFCKIHGFKIENNCFLCEFDNFDNNECDDCDNCPVMWGQDINDTCMRKHDGNDGLYELACNATTWQEQAAIARQIANLPERTDI